MKYCTFNYEVIYEDGNGIHGMAPYRGNSIDHEDLVRFVKGYFAGSKSYNNEDIHVQIIRVYDEPEDWLVDVRHSETFKYLRRVNNFAGDLMSKYFPEE